MPFPFPHSVYWCHLHTIGYQSKPGEKNARRFQHFTKKLPHRKTCTNMMTTRQHMRDMLLRCWLQEIVYLLHAHGDTSYARIFVCSAASSDQRVHVTIWSTCCRHTGSMLLLLLLLLTKQVYRSSYTASRQHVICNLLDAPCDASPAGILVSKTDYQISGFTWQTITRTRPTTAIAVMRSLM
jgi:hypothetical protein